MKTLGAVLAGGRSTRFGSDKALALLGGQSLLDHAIAAIRPQVDAVVVVGDRTDGLATVADWPRPDMGPLGGIAGGLRHADAQGFDQLLSISVDCVRLPRGLRALLDPAPACLESQPVIGLWLVSARGALEALLGEDRDRSMRAFVRRIGARTVTADFIPPNINSPADLDRLTEL